MENLDQNTALGTPLFPLLLGNSKLARHLHHYFHLIDYKHKHFEDARDLQNPDLYRKIKEVNAIWILTNDQSIEAVMNHLKKEMIRHDLRPDDYTFLHSGAASEIEGMHTLHPLMTFGENLYSLEQYQTIPFAVISHEADSLSSRFTLKNPRFSISAKSSSDRALYHAYAVLMSNLPILLWSLTTREAQRKLSLAPELFDPILKQTLENFIQSRGSALTGPIARKDYTTIEKNLAALGDSPLSKIYQSFLTAVSPPEAYHDHRT